MPYKCCMPGCYSNKKENCPYISVFRFPANLRIREKWVSIMKRPGFVPSKYSCICINHFNSWDLLTGPSRSGQRKRPKLHPEAVPSLSPESPAQFIAPAIQHKDQFDVIGSFDELFTYISDNNISDYYNFQTVYNDDSICFLLLNITDRPFIQTSFKIFRDLTVKGWHGGMVVRRSVLKTILGRNFKCNTYLKLMNLLERLNNIDSIATESEHTNIESINRNSNYPIEIETIILE